MSQFNQSSLTSADAPRLSRLRDLWRFMQRRLSEEQVPQVAGSLTFTTVLAVVPVMTIAFAIFTTFPLFNTFRDALEAYFVQSLMPRGVTNTILDNLSLFAAKANRLSAVGAVTLVLTAIMMFAIVDRSLNRIWRVKTPRSFTQSLIVYWAIMTLGPLLIGASLSLTTLVSPVASTLAQQLPWMGTVAAISVSLMLMTMFFGLLYLIVPNRLVDWRDALIGGLVAAIAFEMTNRGFAFFITKFPSYRVIYGALAAVPIFLVWVYLFWLITLLGAVLAVALPVVKHERWWHKPVPGGEFIDAMSVLQVLVHAHQHQGVISLLSIRSKTRLGFDEAESLLQRLLEAGWVGRVEVVKNKASRWLQLARGEHDHWTLLINPNKLAVADVMKLFAFSESSHALGREINQLLDRGLSLSLADYFNTPDAKLNSESRT
jgi:membrane protein